MELYFFNFMQLLKLTNLTSQSGVSEEQRVAIVMNNGSNPSDADIKLGFAGAMTGTVYSIVSV